MKTFFSLVFIFSFRIFFSQDDEEAYFWDGTAVICYPTLDYEFENPDNKGTFNLEEGMMVQNHIPLSYNYTRDPNIKHPKMEEREVGIPDKRTFYYNINLEDSLIEVFDCDRRLRSHNIQEIHTTNKELVIKSENETDTSTIFMSLEKNPTFREVRISRAGDDEETLVNKEVSIYKLYR